jgi:hypothetical protein
MFEFLLAKGSREKSTTVTLGLHFDQVCAR